MNSAVPDFARGLPAGAEHRARCPQCNRNGRDDALAVKIDVDGRGGTFYCHRCEYSGNWHEPINGTRRPTARTTRTSQPEDHAALWGLGVEPGEACEHPYLIAKQVGAHGIRVKDDLLLVPMWGEPTIERQPLFRGGISRQLIGVQTIAPDGLKRYTRGAKKTGAFHLIGDMSSRIVIAEGYATGASIHEATGASVAVAFDCSNLIHVARTLRASFPTTTLILAADDDHRTVGNPGIAKATEAARAVGGLLAVPDFGDDRPEGATDFNDLSAHRGREAVQRAVADARAPDASPDQPADDDRQPDDDRSRWPDPMDEAAMHGIAGEFVRMIEPNTESDPAAILVQFLSSFGALVGRGPHYQVENDQHHTNTNVLLVGPTSKARKGTSAGRVRKPFERIAEWKPHVSGLSSGEGLKYNVRDAREETKKNKHGELVTEITDEGVTDKRLLVLEAEFASALRAAQRQGSTLSATIREAWDSGNLRTLTKHDPIVATGAHICIVGHITADELRAELTATDSANGFANRFLFVAVRRSKLLPFGGEQDDEAEVRAFADRLRERAELARTRRRIGMTENARAMWAKVYPELSAGSDGLHGAVTARAEAQVIRLALIYGLLDGGEAIDVPHLLAALAVWQYCDATAKHIFGASIGDRTADEIMRRLKLAGSGGMTRTEIRDLFGRNLSADRIGAALDLLRRKGKATCESVKTEGRPFELWRAAK